MVVDVYYIMDMLEYRTSYQEVIYNGLMGYCFFKTS
jgi:hypothetical protein